MGLGPKFWVTLGPEKLQTKKVLFFKPKTQISDMGRLIYDKMNRINFRKIFYLKCLLRFLHHFIDPADLILTKCIL